MKILFLSDFYPPLRGGGYAQLCQEVAHLLTLRDQEVWVLTSNYRHRHAPPGETRVLRSLHLEGDLDYYRPVDFLIGWKRRHRENLTILQEAVTNVNPDVLVIWNLRRLSKTLAAVAEGWGTPPTAYYLAGYWPIAVNIHEAYWRAPARHGYLRFPKRILGAIALRQLNGLGSLEPSFRHVMCVSKGLQEALIRKGLPIEGAQVIYNGVDPVQFSPKDPAYSNPDRRNPFRLIYAGQVIPQKGVHTVVEALDLLIHKRSIANVHLTILGSGHPDYEAHIRNLIASRSVGEYIKFLPPIPREEMPAFLRQFDAMVLPSTYEEPLARSIQEAMACEVAVVTTSTGGSREIVIDGENGLSFIPGDASSLADQLERLMSDPGLLERLVRAGRKTVVERFDIRHSVDEIEIYLGSITLSPSAYSYHLVPS